MHIAFDISPISDKNSGHKVRGVGMYITRLKEAIESIDTKNTYTFFSDISEVPKPIDIIHYPYFEPFSITLPVLKKAKTIVTVHDLIPLKFPNAFPAGMKGNARLFIQKYLLNQVDAIITDSESSKKDIIELIGFPKDHIHVISLAADSHFMPITLSKEEKESFQKKYNLPRDYFLYVGDATWNKNLPRLVDAVKEINIPIVFVGKALQENTIASTNPWDVDLTIVQKETIGNNLFIRPGFVSKEDLNLFYNTALALVMPSLYEGFGLPVIEAMQAGCPVLTANSSSLPEVGGDAVLYCNPNDTTDLVKQMKQLASNTALQKQLSHKGTERAKMFSWKKTAEDTIRTYESLYTTR